MTGELTISVRATMDFIPNVNMEEGHAYIANRVNE